jgi:hypothetical protein
MDYPVMTSCAHTFERDAIVNWVERHHCCPISRKPIANDDDLVPNHTLADRIEQWKWQNGGAMGMVDGSEGYSKKATTTGAPLSPTASHDEPTASSSSALELDGIERVDDDDDDIELGASGSMRNNKGSSSYRCHNNKTTEYFPLDQSSSPAGQQRLVLLLPQERRALELAHRQARHDRVKEARQQCRRSFVLMTVMALVATALALAVVWFVHRAPWKGGPGELRRA